MGEHVSVERRGEGKRSRSAVIRVGGKSDQMRGKVKRGGADDSFVSESWSIEEWVQQKTVVQSQSKKVRVIHLQPVGLTVRLSICRLQ